MRFRTRAFLCCFIPFALLLAGSFWMIQKRVQATVRAGLYTSLVENHKAVAQVLAKSDLQSSRFLNVVGENAALKAGVQLLLTYPDSSDARRTVEDQLRVLCEQMGFALLRVAAPDGTPLVAVLRVAGSVQAIDTTGSPMKRSGLVMLNDVAYQVASVPINQADENIGSLSVGEVFDFSEFATPTVLIHDGKVLKSSVGGMATSEVEAAMSHCGTTAECTVRLGGVNYVSLPMQNISFGDGYLLRSLQNLDLALGSGAETAGGCFRQCRAGSVSDCGDCERGVGGIDCAADRDGGGAPERGGENGRSDGVPPG